MKLLKRFLPLLFFLNFNYPSDWTLTENQILIKHNNKDYYSRVAKKDNLTAYYIYRYSDKGEELIGDDSSEVEDYKAISLASHINSNKGKILLRLNRDLNRFREANDVYKIGKILNKLVEEFSELDALLILNIGNKDFSLGEEIYKKYSEEVGNFSKNFINEVIKDQDKIKSLDDLVKKLKEKIFDSSTIEAIENIKKLEDAKGRLRVPHMLSTEEALSIESIISECTIKGHSIAAFQYEYTSNISDFGYQLTHVGSSMLKSFPEGKKVYDLIKELKIDGIEDINSEALKKSLKKMQEVHERVTLSMTLYKRNFDPSLESSLANLLIKEMVKLKESLAEKEADKVYPPLNKSLWSFGDSAVSAYTNPKPISYYFVNIDKDSSSITFEAKAGKETIAFGWADLNIDLKRLNKNVQITFEVEPIYFKHHGFYHIGIVDYERPQAPPKTKIIPYAYYHITEENPNLNPIEWVINLYKDGRLTMKNNTNVSKPYPNYYEFNVSGLNKWSLRILCLTSSSRYEPATKIKFSNFKIKTSSY